MTQYKSINLRLPVPVIETLGAISARHGVSVGRIITALSLIDSDRADAIISKLIPVADDRYPLGKPGPSKLSSADKVLLSLSEDDKRTLLAQIGSGKTRSGKGKPE
ncbi:hypothetical protein [Castellaniella sp.]|uniref:hypothetical protein n=1 Tax=Castellaniella sp. TaxID=1955812 RepID=UPI002AFF7733|nr:hypothetical protein [Castellaniella sp.]